MNPWQKNTKEFLSTPLGQIGAQLMGAIKGVKPEDNLALTNPGLFAQNYCKPHQVEKSMQEIATVAGESGLFGASQHQPQYSENTYVMLAVLDSVLSNKLKAEDMQGANHELWQQIEDLVYQEDIKALVGKALKSSNYQLSDFQLGMKFAQIKGKDAEATMNELYKVLFG